MPLAKDIAAQYFRLAGQQQVLYSYWLDAGDVERARLALNVANWYYQQLQIPFYIPSDSSGYIPNPMDPAAAPAIAASLPVDVGGPAIVRNTVLGGVADTPGSDAGLEPLFGGGSGGNAGGTFLEEYCAYYPDDPICWGQGFTFGGENGGNNGPVYVSNPVTIVINQNGLTLADVASRISGALATAAAAIATAVDSALAAAIGGIQHALNAIGNELMNIYRLLSRLLGKVLNFLKGMLLGVIHGLVAAVEAIGKMLKEVFAHGIVPALQALQKARAWLIKIYERYLRRLLIMLQDIRKVLAILKVFHVDFATKLDNVLADIQRKISAPLLYLLRFTNTIANYINLILDARLFIQRPLFLASLNAVKGSALNLLINAMNPDPDPKAIAALQKTAVIPTPAQTSAEFDKFLQSGGGMIGASLQAPSAQLDAYLKHGVS